MNAAPFIKWAGGKRQLLPEILPRLPAKIGTYYEPFIGGGAVFFALANERRFDCAVIADLNEDLINLYAVVRDSVEHLISVLRPMIHSEDEFYRVRDLAPTAPVARAARFLYLNRTCFNGLYRVNKAGKFNVPFGRYKNPTICDDIALRAASRALQSATLLVGDFAETMAGARMGDAVYLDPPYLPASATSNFAAYQAGGFGVADTVRLADACRSLRDRRVPFLVSNADTPKVRECFAGLDIVSVSARRSINSKGEKRGTVGEVLVTAGSVALEESA